MFFWAEKEINYSIFCSPLLAERWQQEKIVIFSTEYEGNMKRTPKINIKIFHFYY